MRIKSVLLFMALLSATWAYGQQADSVVFLVRVAERVQTGAPFKVAFEVDTLHATGFAGPSFDGLKVLAGPSVIQSSSLVMRNGKAERSVSLSYTYVLIAEGAGTYTIAEAAIEVGGKRYTTLPAEVTVSDEDPAQTPEEKAPAPPPDVREEPSGEAPRTDSIRRILPVPPGTRYI